MAGNLGCLLMLFGVCLYRLLGLVPAATVCVTMVVFDVVVIGRVFLNGRLERHRREPLLGNCFLDERNT